METFGLLFYWISWLIWVLVTFFMKKSKQRTLLFCSVLLLIIFSNTYVTVGSFNISISYVLLLIGSLVIYTLLEKQFYHAFVSFTVMIGYSGLLIWINSTPLWLFLHELLIIPFVCNFIILLLTKGIYSRITTGLLGIVAGELFYNFILASYHFNQPIGDLMFFDRLLVTIALLLILHLILQSINTLDLLQKNYHQKINSQKTTPLKKLS